MLSFVEMHVCLCTSSSCKLCSGFMEGSWEFQLSTVRMMGAQTSGCTHFGSVPEVIKSLLAPYEFTLFLHCICGSSSPATIGWEMLRNSMLNPLYTTLFVSKACFPSRSGLRSLGITNSATKENLFKAYARKERHLNSMLTHPNTHIYIQIHTLLYKFIYIAWTIFTEKAE